MHVAAAHDNAGDVLVTKDEAGLSDVVEKLLAHLKRPVYTFPFFLMVLIGG